MHPVLITAWVAMAGGGVGMVVGGMAENYTASRHLCNPGVLILNCTISGALSATFVTIIYLLA